MEALEFRTKMRDSFRVMGNGSFTFLAQQGADLH